MSTAKEYVEVREAWAKNMESLAGQAPAPPSLQLKILGYRSDKTFALILESGSLAMMLNGARFMFNGAEAAREFARWILDVFPEGEETK